MVFFQLGVEGSNASTAAVIFSINPLFTIVFAHFITEEKLNVRKVVALTFGLAGIVLMMRLWDIDPGNSGAGLAFSVISAVIFGLYSAMSKNGIRKRGGLTQTSLSFLFGSLTMLPILWFVGKPVVSGINAGNILLVLYIGIMVSGLGYLFYFLIMERADAATASIVFFVKPALAPVIAVLVLDESMRMSGVFGIMLILISSFINLKKPKRKDHLD
jgi:drug/metabolite transporter (DMT)-like permease